MPKPAPVKVQMEHEKETKNMVRFQCNDEDAPISKLYIKKDLIDKWGKPENLDITIEAP